MSSIQARRQLCTKAEADEVPVWALEHAKKIGAKANSWAVFGLTLTGMSAVGGLIKWESTNLKKEMDKTSEEVAETKIEVADKIRAACSSSGHEIII